MLKVAPPGKRARKGMFTRPLDNGAIFFVGNMEVFPARDFSTRSRLRPTDFAVTTRSVEMTGGWGGVCPCGGRANWRAAEVPFIALSGLASSICTHRSGRQCDGWLLTGRMLKGMFTRPPENGAIFFVGNMEVFPARDFSTRFRLRPTDFAVTTRSVEMTGGWGGFARMPI